MANWHARTRTHKAWRFRKFFCFFERESKLGIFCWFCWCPCKRSARFYFIVLFYRVKSLVLLRLRILTLNLHSQHVWFSEYYQLCQRRDVFSVLYNLTPCYFGWGEGGLFYKLNVSDYKDWHNLIVCSQCWPNGDVMFIMLYVYTQSMCVPSTGCRVSAFPDSDITWKCNSGLLW